MSMDVKKYSITQEELAGVGVLGLADSPNLSALEMQKKFEETAREVIIPKHNALVEALADETAAAGIGAKDPTADGGKSTVQMTLDRLYENTQQVREANESAQNAAEAAKQAAEEATEQLKQKAPVNHASTGVDYGVADSGRFGHVKLSDSLIEAVDGQGVAASQKAVNTVYEYAKTINAKADAAVSTNAQSLSASQQAQARANIGAVAVGEGGSWVQDDWDAAEGVDGHIKNRTHWREWAYTEIVEEVTKTIEATSLTFLVDAGGFANVQEGNTYRVMWDGVSYHCVCKKVDDAFYIGNLYAYFPDKTRTDEPFCIKYTGAASAWVFDLEKQDTGGSVEVTRTFQMDLVITTYHKLPEEYLPESAATKAWVEELIGGIENGTY